MNLIDVDAFDCRLIVDYGSDGRHYLYDIEKISRNMQLANSILQMERKDANGAPSRVADFSADAHRIAPDEGKVNRANRQRE